jgi:high-affinity iron transporter
VLAALIIVFREVFEAALITGIILAVTRGVPGRGLWVAAGIAGGTLGACLVAVFTGAISQAFEGVGQELFNAAILGLAAVMLTWHNVWMARHGRELAAEMRAAGEAVVAGAKSLLGLTIVVGVAVLREGVEVVLFLYGVLAADAGGGFAVFIGSLAGLALGATVGALAYFGLLRIPARHLFAVTSVMIAFLAAGMALQATAFLEQANVVTAFGRIVWDSSHYLPDTSLIGRALRTLVGYSDRPTALELIVYLVTLTTIFILMRVLSPSGAPEPARAHRA